MRSAFLISLVVARKPAVLTVELGPNRIPSGLIRKMRPLADRAPWTVDGPSPPTTRSSPTEVELG
jgi:hypothetical protein